MCPLRKVEKREGGVMDKQQYKLVEFLKNASQQPTKVDDELLVWISLNELEKFVSLVGHGYLCENGLDVNLQYDCICFNCKDVLDYFGIELDVFDEVE